MIPIVDHILGYFSDSLGVDLGTVNTLIHVHGKGIVIHEPSIIAQHKKTKKILAIGADAREMLGRTPTNIICTRPLKNGVISDYDTTLAMLSYFVQKIHTKPSGGFSLSRPRMIIGVPMQVTAVGQKALLDVARDAGAQTVYLVEEPILAALGAGLTINEPVGSMIVDIGGGTCEIAVISLCGVVCGGSLKIAASTMDSDIVGYVRSRWGISIGEKTAEEVKIKLGSAFEDEIEKEMIIRGLDLEKGLPRSIKLSTVQIREALASSLNSIIGAIKDVIHDAPPELVGDIAERGIVLSGGGAQLLGIAKFISQETKMPVWLADEPLFGVIRGCARLLSDVGLLEKVKVVKAR